MVVPSLITPSLDWAYTINQMVQNKDVVGTSDMRVSAVLTADMHLAKGRERDVRGKNTFSSDFNIHKYSRNSSHSG